MVLTPSALRQALKRCLHAKSEFLCKTAAGRACRAAILLFAQKDEKCRDLCLTGCRFFSIIALACSTETVKYGGVAQLARAFGSYPECHRFKSSRRYQNGNTSVFPEYGPLVKRLRHRPFTAVTRVRIPYGSPQFWGAAFAPYCCPWRLSSAG